MPPSLTAARDSGQNWLAAIPAHWRGALIRLAIAWLLLIAMFAEDWSAMASQWWYISTYNHILLIPVILGWFVANRREELLHIRPKAWWPGLFISAGACFVWLLGALSGLDLARQLGAVALTISCVAVLLGVRVSAALLFPLGYALLLVPFGDILVPPLQMLTAKMTIALVDLSGIPATIDGVFIDTPAGLFVVAEACSGVNFLIAMAAFGLLVANVCFASWRRRAVFMTACLIVPILANGVRAWGTIYAAQHFGIAAASGFDHIVYGWIFFALVMGIVLAGSWRFFDRPVDEPAIDAQSLNRSPGLGRLERLEAGILPSLAILLLLAVASQSWARTANGMSAALPDQISLPDVPGWSRADYEPAIWWQPRADGAEHRLLGRYANQNGQHVDVFIALYSGQENGREAGGFGQGALTPETGWTWLSKGPDMARAKSDRLIAGGNVQRLALTWYRTGVVMAGSNIRLKLANMADRLFLNAEPTAMLILSAEEQPGKPAIASIRQFRKATGPLDEWMDRVAGLD